MQEQRNARGLKVITSGYVSMDRIIKLKSPARVGFTSLVTNKTSADIHYGGCSVNISYDLRKLGVEAVPIMRVGEDYEEIGFGNFLKEAGISLEATTVIEGERTSVCYLLQDNEGQHITLFYPGAMDGRLAAPPGNEIFRGAALGVMTVGSRRDNELFFEACKKNQIPLVFSMKGDMDAFPREFLEELLQYSTLIFTNEVERETIERIFGKDMSELLNTGKCQILVTTLGEKGSRCVYRENGRTKEAFVPVWPHCRLVDTTGSGDGFVSGFLYGYLKEKTPKECAKLGTIFSSYIIEQEGCCEGAPSEEMLLGRLEEFERFLKGGR